MTEPLDRRRFLQRAAGAGLVLGGLGELDGLGADARAAVPPAVPAPAGAPGLALRGVTYDTGTLTLGETTRRVWTAARMEAELGAISDGLQCTTVTVFGSTPARLAQTAEAALRRGLHVSIQPRLYDYSAAEILRQLGETGERAERLRSRYPGMVTLIAGCEHMLFTPGIVPGENFLDRIAALNSGKLDFPAVFRRLDSFLARARKVARRSFGGPLTYAAAEFEAPVVDWSRFDLVGLDYYAFHRSLAGHTRTLAPYRRWRKPIAILEFGCCTYRGAPRRGGSGYEVVDYSHEPPLLEPGIVRSEATQADYIAHMFDVFEREQVGSASVYTFISPDSPWERKPRQNLDTASFALVETIRERPRDPASPYRWRPKQSFATVAASNVRGSR